VSAPENANKQETAVGFIVSRVQGAGANARIHAFARDDVFAVLFRGNRRSFDAWARTVATHDALEARRRETVR
jgi:hypothetical protein